MSEWETSRQKKPNCFVGLQKFRNVSYFWTAIPPFLLLMMAIIQNNGKTKPSWNTQSFQQLRYCHWMCMHSSCQEVFSRSRFTYKVQHLLLSIITFCDFQIRADTSLRFISVFRLKKFLQLITFSPSWVCKVLWEAFLPTGERTWVCFFLASRG